LIFPSAVDENLYAQMREQAQIFGLSESFKEIIAQNAFVRNVGDIEIAKSESSWVSRRVEQTLRKGLLVTPDLLLRENEGVAVDGVRVYQSIVAHRL
jgi:hypothetical protein